jgi:cytochrome c peroxidase
MNQRSTSGFLTASIFMLAITPVAFCAALLSPQLRSLPQYRVPVDLVCQNDFLFVANSRTGSVSKIDMTSNQLQAEWKVAESLSGIAAWRKGLLLLDDHAHRLLWSIEEPGSSGLEPLLSLELPLYPVDVAVSADETSVAVSSLWSRTVTLFRGQQDGLQKERQLSLSFAPRTMLYLPDGKLIVADSFAGRLAIVDTAAGSVLKEHDVYGHNIRGLGLNHKHGKLLVACQTLDPATFTTYERVFWGVLMQNGLHSIPLDQLLSVSGDAEDTAPEEAEYSGTSYASQQRYPLGTPSIGSGDPGAMVVTENDLTLIVISGVNQVAFRTASHMPFERLQTGKRPEAICLDSEQKKAFIANRFGDSVTVVSLEGKAPAVETTISLGEIRELTLAEHGEQTFYDASVSLDGWFSCHSCHTDGHTNGQRADTFGDEDRGAPKKVVSLRGVSDSGPWAWTGSKSSLDEQIKTSLIVSMQTQIPTEELPIERLSAYLKTLTPAPSLRLAKNKMPNGDVLAAARIGFEAAGCQNCHAGTGLTSNDTYDVGIHDEQGETLFNPPSLRGVSQRAPYFHDGRAATLAEVLKTSHHNSEMALSEKQIEQLQLLLESL